MELFPFVVAEVRELVDFLGEAGGLNVVVDDVFVDLREEGESVLVLLLGSVAPSVLGHEADEFLLSGGHGGGEEGGCFG